VGGVLGGPPGAAIPLKTFRREKFWPAARLSSHIHSDPIRDRSARPREAWEGPYSSLLSFQVSAAKAKRPLPSLAQALAACGDLDARFFRFTAAIELVCGSARDAQSPHSGSTLTANTHRERDESKGQSVSRFRESFARSRSALAAGRITQMLTFTSPL
jgi:hypothetical protein